MSGALPGYGTVVILPTVDITDHIIPRRRTLAACKMDPGQARARLGSGVGSNSHAAISMMDDVEGGDGYVAKRYRPNGRSHSSSSNQVSNFADDWELCWCGGRGGAGGGGEGTFLPKMLFFFVLQVGSVI